MPEWNRTAPAEQPIAPGAVIGRYALVRFISEGGMGEVWQAERRDTFRQRVAIKFMHAGRASPREALARFELEREVLAALDHPNIARIFDGGMHHGRPWFAMEYVDGVPITDFCDRGQGCDLADRLVLFHQVCDAVTHAHRRGIIHRDLKPSNILVCQGTGGTPVVKVIDFGIAKAMTSRLLIGEGITQEHRPIGTFEYMSPEQADPMGRDIDSRTDVYSLGVVLYELLAGVKPFDLQRRAEVEARRIVLEEEAPTPSLRLSTVASRDSGSALRISRARRDEVHRLIGRLRDELEWIPLMAIRKDRERRYSSPEELSRDIDNYVSGRPLLAAPESAWYRVRKFVRRRRAVLSALGAVACALVIGTALALWQWSLATRERNAARQSQEFIGDLFRPQVDLGRPAEVVDLIRLGGQSAESRFSDDPASYAWVLTVMAEGAVVAEEWTLAGDLSERGMTAAEAGGRRDLRDRCDGIRLESGYRSGSSADPVLALKEALRALPDPESDSSLRLRNQLAGALKWQGDLDAADREYGLVLAAYEERDGEGSWHALQARHNMNLVELARWRRLGEAEGEPAARELGQRVLEQRTALCLDMRRWLGETDWLVRWSDAERLGLMSELGEHAQAIKEYPSVLDDLRACFGPSSWMVAETQARYGRALASEGRSEDAIDQYLSALQVYRLLRPGHRDTSTLAWLLVKELRKAGLVEPARWVLERACLDWHRRQQGPSADDTSEQQAKAWVDRVRQFCREEGPGPARPEAVAAPCRCGS